MSNKVIEIINNRVSLRRFKDKIISQEHIDIILQSAFNAPTGGNQMLYSIIQIQNKDTLQKLSETCDNQKFIATAPFALIFLADQQKWFDYYKMCGVEEFENKRGREMRTPEEADLLLAIQDAVIAAQNTVIAAESLGIGSCYIGDILENYEIHKELLNLGEFTFPISMLVFGYYPDGYNRVHRKRFDKEYIVFQEKYKKLTADELAKMFAEREKQYNSQNKWGAENFAQMFYSRKTGAEFSVEMARSVKKMLQIWQEKDMF